LQEREDALKEREYKLKQDEERLLKLAHMDAKLHLEEIKENYDKEIEDLKIEFKEKFKDQKRLHEAFKAIKQTNESLKQQLNETQEKTSRMEKQNSALNNRLVNLQVRNLFFLEKNFFHLFIDFKKKIENTKPSCSVSAIDKKTSVNSALVKPKISSSFQNLNQFSQQQTLVHNANILEAFAMLLDWLSQAHLKESINFSLPISNNSQIMDKSCRLLPLLAELIIHLNNANISNLVAQSFQKYHLAFLEFIYWSLLHYDLSLQSSKVNLTATFRRIGEELYRSYNKSYKENQAGSTELAWLRNNELQQHNHQMEQNENSTESQPAATTCLFSLFLQGNNMPVRMLSCLIILRTLSQADYINNIFEILRHDLKDDTLKKLFLTYFGTWTILKWCKLTNKVKKKTFCFSSI